MSCLFMTRFLNYVQFQFSSYFIMIFKIRIKDGNKLTVMKELLVAGNYFPNALLLKAAPLPLGHSMPLSVIKCLIQYRQS